MGVAKCQVHQPVHYTVARFLMGVTHRYAPEQGQADVAEVNGEPAFILRVNGTVCLVISLELTEIKTEMNNTEMNKEDMRVRAIHIVGNPEKLRQLNSGYSGEHLDSV